MKNKKQLTGKVVSVKATKTIIVAVESYKKNKLYGKRYKATKRFPAHDENSTAKLGDTVKIIETRPLSKTKNFRLFEVLETNVEA
ncbi:MAG: 30S ribosomal protein S17 [Mollicutes bacterium PWAP]|nr:30S ribosomal protein S17 [Mollicutes bacterium PWAP]